MHTLIAFSVYLHGLGLMNSYITTWSGRKFNFLNPEPTHIVIEDIAHALSLQCRFNGHCSEFYSVAEHCVEVSRLIEAQGHPRNIVMTALLHDAAEAYIGDVVSPLKKVLVDYQDIEYTVESAIADKFSLVFPMPEAVREADREVLLLEFGSLQPFTDTPGRLRCLPPKEAETLFMGEYKRLCLVDE